MLPHTLQRVTLPSRPRLSGLEIVGRKHWGAFPLKGKLLNVRDASAKQLLENTEVQNICKILGLVPFQPPNPAQMRYGHVVVMADQDHDGSHIQGPAHQYVSQILAQITQNARVPQDI